MPLTFRMEHYTWNVYSRYRVKLPAEADRCGENGEYHSFVFDGPIFQDPIPYTLGEVTSFESRYYYSNLIPKDT